MIEELKKQLQSNLLIKNMFQYLATRNMKMPRMLLLFQGWHVLRINMAKWPKTLAAQRPSSWP
jgi:hypothetical protein